MLDTKRINSAPTTVIVNERPPPPPIINSNRAENIITGIVVVGVAAAAVYAANRLLAEPITTSAPPPPPSPAATSQVRMLNEREIDMQQTWSYFIDACLLHIDGLTLPAAEKATYKNLIMNMAVERTENGARRIAVQMAHWSNLPEQITFERLLAAANTQQAMRRMLG